MSKFESKKTQKHNLLRYVQGMFWGIKEVYLMYATGMTMHIKCILRSYLNNIKKFSSNAVGYHTMHLVRR